MNRSVEHYGNGSDRRKSKYSERSIKMNRSVEHYGNSSDRGKSKYLERNLFQCNFDHHISDVHRPRTESGLPLQESDD